MVNIQNYEKLNIDLSAYAGSNKQKLPKSAQEMLRKIKEALQSSEVKKIFSKLGIGERIEFRYQGSYNEDTSNDYFRIIDKSDIDLIMLLESAQTTSCIIENPEKNKDMRDWTGSVSPQIRESFSLEKCRCKLMELEGYVEIFKFKLLKDSIFEFLKNRFPNYFFENRKKVIKIGLNPDFHANNIELAIAGKLFLHICSPNMTLKLWEMLEKNNILQRLAYGNYNLTGYNLITSEPVPGRANYFREIPNFSNINALNLKRKSSKTNFLRYVIFYKNFIKIWNEKRCNFFKIDISSFHIESLLYNLDSSLFIFNLSPTNIRRINEKLLGLVSSPGRYFALTEINEIFSINRNTNYWQIRNAIHLLKRACDLEWHS